MVNRHKARELAMQVLYLWDAHGNDDFGLAQQAVAGATDDHDLSRAGIEMAQAAWKQREMSDPWIERLAPHWPPRRQPAVDRSIIRLAVWEMTATDTPPRVAIDEAIELAKLYSTEHSPGFINGVLDAVMRERGRMTNDQAAMTNK